MSPNCAAVVIAESPAPVISQTLPDRLLTLLRVIRADGLFFRVNIVDNMPPFGAAPLVSGTNRSDCVCSITADLC